MILTLNLFGKLQHIDMEDRPDLMKEAFFEWFLEGFIERGTEYDAYKELQETAKKLFDERWQELQSNFKGLV